MKTLIILHVGNFLIRIFDFFRFHDLALKISDIQLNVILDEIWEEEEIDHVR